MSSRRFINSAIFLQTVVNSKIYLTTILKDNAKSVPPLSKIYVTSAFGPHPLSSSPPLLPPPSAVTVYLYCKHKRETNTKFVAPLRHDVADVLSAIKTVSRGITLSVTRTSAPSIMS